MDLTSIIQDSEAVYDDIHHKHKKEYLEDSITENSILNTGIEKDITEVMEKFWNKPDTAIVRNISNFENSNGIIKAEGDIRFRYQGYDVTAKYLEYDTQKKKILLSGDVMFISEDASIFASNIEYFSETKSYRIYNTDNILGPEVLGHGVSGNWYLKSPRGSGKRSSHEFNSCSITSCGIENPHYEIKADYMRIKPGERIILKNADFYLGSKLLFTIPSLNIPLDNDQDYKMPTFGYSDSLGYYFKSRWGIEIGKDVDLDIIVRYYSYLKDVQKSGNGFGGKLKYKRGLFEGSQYFYQLPSKYFYHYEGVHTHNIHGGVLKLASLFRTRRSEFGSSYLPTTFYSVEYYKAGALSKNGLSAEQYKYHYPDKNIEQIEYEFNHSARNTKGVRLSNALDVKYKLESDSSYISKSDYNDFRSQIYLDWKTKYDHDFFNVATYYRRKFYLHEYNVNDIRLPDKSDLIPELKLSTSFKKLFHNTDFKFYETLPLDVDIKTFSAFSDRIYDNSTKEEEKRYFKYLNAKSLSLKSSKDIHRSYIDFGWKNVFNQSFFEGDTSHYDVSFKPYIQYHLNSLLYFKNTLVYNHYDGYTPFDIYHFSKEKHLSFLLSLKSKQLLDFSLSTRYNLREDRPKVKKYPWSPLVCSLNLTPWQDFKINLSSRYLFKSLAWSDIYLDMVGTLFGCDMKWENYFTDHISSHERKKTLKRSRLALKGLEIGPILATVCMEYNGFEKTFRDFSWVLTYNLHCAELSLVKKRLSGSPVGEYSYGLFFNLKSYPEELGKFFRKTE